MAGRRTASTAAVRTLAMPGAVEMQTWGHPTLRVRAMIVVSLSNEDDEEALRADQGEPRVAVVAFDAETH